MAKQELQGYPTITQVKSALDAGVSANEKVNGVKVAEGTGNAVVGSASYALKKVAIDLKIGDTIIVESTAGFGTIYNEFFVYGTNYANIGLNSVKVSKVETTLSKDVSNISIGVGSAKVLANGTIGFRVTKKANTFATTEEFAELKNELNDINNSQQDIVGMRNLFNENNCTSGYSLDDNGLAAVDSDYWISDFVDASTDNILSNYKLISVCLYGDDKTSLLAKLTTSTGLSFDLSAYPTAKYMRFAVYKNTLSFADRKKLRVHDAKCSANTIPSNLEIEPSIVDFRKQGYFVLDDLMKYSATIIKGTKSSSSSFTKTDGSVAELNNYYIYVDTTDNYMYRWNGTELYKVCYYDSKAVPFTKGFTFVVNRNWESEKNMIISASAKYISNSSNVPTIYTKPMVGFSAALSSPRATMKYTLGKSNVFSKKEWRAYPYNRIQDRTYIYVEIPSDVTLFIDEIGNYYSDKKTFGSYPILNCRNTNAPSQSLASAEQAIKIGYDHVVVIPKRSADGVWFVCHDDATISDSNVIRNEDGSIIENKKAPTAYNYDEIKDMEVGLTGYSSMGLAWRGQKIYLLEDFLFLCSKTGTHPVFSVHPNWSTSEWNEVKSFTDKFGITSKLNLKGNLENILGSSYSVFGDNIESYFEDVNDSTKSAISSNGKLNIVNTINGLISTYNIDTDKCIVGIEFFNNYATDDNITNVVSNGLPCAVVADNTDLTSVQYENWIKLGVSQFTDVFNPSVGLNW